MLKYFKYRMAMPISSVQSMASDFHVFHHTWINETTGRLKGISKWASEKEVDKKCVCVCVFFTEKKF